MSALTLTFQDTNLDVIDQNNQPWLRGYQIGTALGYTQGTQAISKIFDRNADEFTETMTALVELETEGGKQQVRIFSLRGCHLLAMLSRTKIAKEFRKWVLDILEHSKPEEFSQLPPPKTKKALPGCLTEETQDEIKQLILSRAATFPREKQAGIIVSMWSALGTHFGVKKQPGDKIPAYKHIPEGMRMECLSLIARLSVDNLITLTTEEFSERVKALEGEVLPKEPFKMSFTAEELSALLIERMKALEGEVMPKQEPQQDAIHISINGGMRMMTVIFEGKVDKMARYLVQVEQNFASIHAIPLEAIAMTEPEFAKYMIEERGYIVVKKTEVLDKLQA